MDPPAPSPMNRMETWVKKITNRDMSCAHASGSASAEVASSSAYGTLAQRPPRLARLALPASLAEREPGGAPDVSQWATRRVAAGATVAP